MKMDMLKMKTGALVVISLYLTMRIIQVGQDSNRFEWTMLLVLGSVIWLAIEVGKELVYEKVRRSGGGGVRGR